MVRHHIKLQPRRSGFTLIEILVVVGIILLLMTISVGALRSAIGTARQNQTEATIMKVNGLMQQRLDAFYRAMERTNLQQAKDKMKRDWYSTYNFVPPDAAIEVMTKKSIIQSRFPQNYLERNLLTNPPMGATVVAANHKPVTESASLLYWILTNSEVYGVGPVDESEFSSTEVRDTDGDGLLEFVDGWGRPLRYYRWPTHLFRPGNTVTNVSPGVDSSGNLTAVDRTFATLIWSGLPALPTAAGEFDPLVRDPDDPTGQLLRFVTLNPTAMTGVQNFYGTPSTYNAFLIISAGPDGNLGMYEPSNEASVTITSPALGVPQGRLGAVIDTNPSNISNNPLTDNISNRKR